jgi:hypothetical protein
MNDNKQVSVEMMISQHDKLKVIIEFLLPLIIINIVVVNQHTVHY